MMRRVIVLAALLLLSGCASWKFTGTTPGGPANFDSWQQRLGVIETVDSWQLNGRLSVSGKDTEDAQGKLAWQQQDRNFKLNVRGPFGIGATRISGDGQSVTVKNKNGEFYAPDAEAAIREQIGWEVPIDSLRYWVLGRPAPSGVASMDVNSLGQLVAISQNGWQVAYTEYGERGKASVELPKRLVAKRPGVEVRLAIDTWRLP